MNDQVKRNYLEIKSLHDLVAKEKPFENLNLLKVQPVDFQINKFFYKNVGKKHHWVDRLVWTDKQWGDYVSNEKVKTHVLKNNDDFAGYFELILHQNEIEIAYLGLLEEYQNQKLGSFLLESAIKISFLEKPKRVWVHTCSLDHKNALNNYLARGMKVFKRETIRI